MISLTEEILTIPSKYFNTNRLQHSHGLTLNYVPFYNIF